MEYVVYWLYDDTCLDFNLHGYIGITSRLERRIRRHKHEKRFPKFQVSILFRGTQEQCLELEERLRPMPRIGWNRGIGGWETALGSKRTEEFKEAARARLLGKPSPIKGIKFSADAILNMSKAQKGRPKSDEHRRNLAIAATGYVHTLETRAKMSISAKGKPKPVEWRKWMSENSSQRFNSPEGRKAQFAKSRRGIQSRNVKCYNDSAWILGI